MKLNINEVKRLLCIDNYNTDPYKNLATEEYLLKNKTDDVFMLWCNQPTVVVGKHQNTLAEINDQFIRKQNIKVARRISGGGTVYHDLGNLNFTYIMNGEKGKLVDFKKYTNDILEVLNEIGVPAIRNLRNDLVINNKKFSGNAEHIFKQRVIHHGTLLFNSNLETLNQAIKVKIGEYNDRAVQSVRSSVTNIYPYLKEEMDMKVFRNKLMDFMLKKYNHAILYTLIEEENKAIEKLEEEKYVTWDWIYGYSPKYVLKKTLQFSKNKLDIELTIKKGIIIEAIFSGNLLDDMELEKLSNCLVGQRHNKGDLISEISHNTEFQGIKSFPVNEIINKLF